MSSGLSFGKWITLDEIVGSSNSFICVCECGTVRIVDSRTLRNGRSISCGCSRRRPLKLTNTAFNEVFGYYKANARKRNLIWELNEDFCKNLFQSKCYYCGSLPLNTWRTKYSEFTYTGIDRINNKEGYTVNNTVPCCIICNRAKSNLSYDKFILWIQNLIQHQKGNYAEIN